jgi:hypothetical protein
VTNANKAKGTRWELAIRRFLREHGIDAFKPYEEGHEDAGDIHGVDPFVLQAKDWRAVTDALREGLDGAERQAIVAGRDYGAAVVKRARRPVGSAYVVMTLDTFVALLRRLRGLPPEQDSPSD